MTKSIAQIFISTLVGLFAITAIYYNSLQRQEELVFQAWGNLDSTLKRRADLIPNLVNVAKAYSIHEQDTFKAVVDARSNAQHTLTKAQLSDPQKVATFLESQKALDTSLSQLMVVVENYPELKANEVFKDLQHQLEGTENRINYARQKVNEATQNLNTSLRTLPGAWVNKFFCGLEPKTFIQIQSQDQEPAVVNF